MDSLWCRPATSKRATRLLVAGSHTKIICTYVALCKRVLPPARAHLHGEDMPYKILCITPSSPRRCSSQASPKKEA